MTWAWHRWSWRAGAALLLSLGLSRMLHAESVIDYGAVQNPRSLLLSDGGAQARWQALFEPSPAWASRQIAFLAWRAPDKLATLLAARLLYIGEPGCAARMTPPTSGAGTSPTSRPGPPSCARSAG